MADTVQRVDYFHVQGPNKPGEGARYLAALQEAGINLVAFSGFPEGRGSQLDFVPADAAAFRGFARRSRWKITGPKRAFLLGGEDRVGVITACVRRALRTTRPRSCRPLPAGGRRPDCA